METHRCSRQNAGRSRSPVLIFNNVLFRLKIELLARLGDGTA